MLSSLKIIHICHSEYPDQIVNTIGDATVQRYFVWQTCLRTIIFSKSEEEYKETKYSDIYQGEEAYKFLLEIICGLHSKLIGETEILSQFKQFITKNPHALSKKISNKLIQNSKTIRNKHLSGYGGQSYGSFVNNACKEYQKIVLLGAGALTQDILPIIKHTPIEITVKTRSIKKYSFLTDRYPNINLEVYENKEKSKEKSKETFKEKSDAPTLLVIAAPISSLELEEYVDKNYEKVKVLDMRAANHDRKLNLKSSHQYHALNDIFEKLSSTHDKLKQRLPAIKQDITAITNKWNTYILQRPYGWDDLC